MKSQTKKLLALSALAGLLCAATPRTGSDFVVMNASQIYNNVISNGLPYWQSAGYEVINYQASSNAPKLTMPWGAAIGSNNLAQVLADLSAQGFSIVHADENLTFTLKR